MTERRTGNGGYDLETMGMTLSVAVGLYQPPYSTKENGIRIVD